MLIIKILNNFSKKALALKSNSLEQAIEWLSEHANDPVVEETKPESAQAMETTNEASTGT